MQKHAFGVFAGLGHRVLIAMLTQNTSPVEFQSGVSLLVVGIWMMLHRSVLEIFVYVAPVNFWASILVFVGLLQLGSVILGFLPFRATTAFMSFIIWHLLAYLCWNNSGCLGSAKVVWPVYAMMQTFCYLSISSRYRGTMLRD